jgi:hypothetical protein
MTRGGAYWVRPLSSPFGLPLVSLLVASCFILLTDIFLVCLCRVHLTTIPASATTHDLHLLSPRSTRLLAAASSQAQARVAPGGMVQLRSMSCPSTSAGRGVPDDFACMSRDGARYHCDSFSRAPNDLTPPFREPSRRPCPARAARAAYAVRASARARALPRPPPRPSAADGVERARSIDTASTDLPTHTSTDVAIRECGTFTS